MIEEDEKTLVIDSHMSHFLPKDYVELCVVTKCDLKTLKIRLEARGYSEAKVKENMDAEIFDVCRVEAEEMGHNVITITTSSPADVQDAIEDIDFFTHIS